MRVIPFGGLGIPTTVNLEPGTLGIYLEGLVLTWVAAT